MKVLKKVACCVFVLSMEQAAFCHPIIISPFLSTSGVSSGYTTAEEMARREELGLDQADMEAVREGRMTSRIREIAEESGKSDEQTLKILQDEFNVRPE